MDLVRHVEAVEVEKLQDSAGCETAYPLVN